jgi:hypothetical protein
VSGIDGPALRSLSPAYIAGHASSRRQRNKM